MIEKVYIDLEDNFNIFMNKYLLDTIFTLEEGKVFNQEHALKEYSAKTPTQFLNIYLMNQMFFDKKYGVNILCDLKSAYVSELFNEKKLFYNQSYLKKVLKHLKDDKEYFNDICNDRENSIRELINVYSNVILNYGFPIKFNFSDFLEPVQNVSKSNLLDKDLQEVFSILENKINVIKNTKLKDFVRFKFKSFGIYEDCTVEEFLIRYAIYKETENISSSTFKYLNLVYSEYLNELKKDSNPATKLVISEYRNILSEYGIPYEIDFYSTIYNKASKLISKGDVKIPVTISELKEKQKEKV